MSRLKDYKRVAATIWPRSGQPRAADLQLMSDVKQRATAMRSLSNRDLKHFADNLREHTTRGTDLYATDTLVPCFAMTYEAVRRTTLLEFFDVQLLAGFVLATGAIAEMQTGEGKTIVAALPAVLHALTGRGVHVATVNSYLAQRDHELLQPAYEMLGLTAGLVKDQAPPQEKKQAYDCDITYATGYQLGFDYLFDQIALQRPDNICLGDAYRIRFRNSRPSVPQTMQRGQAFAIIDEIDSVLIDEANTPLIISGGGGGQGEAESSVYLAARKTAENLARDEDFVLDVSVGRVQLTERGAARIHTLASASHATNLSRPWSIYVEQALRARYILQRDVDYVVRDEAVMIVDQYTGRIFAERTWRDGLHQAVEAKENAPMTAEKCSLARISRQRYFRLYDKVCGMTGTASGNEYEFAKFYGLPVVIVPPHRPCQRKQIATRYFVDQQAKFAALARDVAQRHRHGQPVLIGTRTIKESLQLAEHLTAEDVRYQILNGIQDEREATLVARAGRPGAITIATNMAGRGTDIRLPGKSIDAGGLHVVATEHHEAKRIDRQLVGRSARQGDPGSCQFLIAADDELIARYDPQLGEHLRRSADGQGEVHDNFARPLERLQKQCEKRGFAHRCDLLRQEKWLENVLETVAKED